MGFEMRRLTRNSTADIAPAYWFDTPGVDGGPTQMTSFHARPSMAPHLSQLSGDIDAAYERLYGGGQSVLGQIVEHAGEAGNDTTDDIERLKDLASEAPVIRLVNMLITQAVEARASDNPTANG